MKAFFKSRGHKRSDSRRDLAPAPAKSSGEAGFSLIEVAVAFVMIMVAVLGVFFTITYAITYNSGNYLRAQALAVLQDQAEKIRSAKFTPSYADPILQGGTQPDQTVTLPNGSQYIVSTVVDNDPNTAGIQDETVTTSYKEVTITTTFANMSPGWTSAIPTKVVLRRVKSN